MKDTFYLKHFSSNSIIHEIIEEGRLLFLTGEAEGRISAASWFEIDI